MANNISRHTLGLTELQSGQGTPTHQADLGSLYIDVLTADYYKNIDGFTNWVLLTSGGGGGGITGDTYVTGFTYNNANKITISQNQGQSDLDIFINQFSGLTVNGILSATTYYGDGSNLTGISSTDNFVTGGTFNSGTGTLTLNRQNGTVTVTGFTDTFVTGFTFSSNTLTITQNQGRPNLSASIQTIDLSNVLSAVTFNIGTIGSISATTYYGSGANLTGIANFFVTGGTFNSGTGTLTLNRQNGSVTVTGFTDNFVTGGTYSSGTLTLNRQNGSVTITGLTTTDTFVTGFTYNNANTLTISRNQGLGNLTANISIMSGLTVAGNLTVTGNTSLRSFTGTSALITSTGQNVLTIIGSGSSTTAPLFSIQGSQGELFSVTDSLTGSLFSVNDISGLPILEVFSDSTTLQGSYLAPSLNTTKRVSLTAGTNFVYAIPTSAYTGAFFDYTVVGSGARAGTIMSIWSGTSIQYTDVSTNDIGNTVGVTFSMAVSSGNAILSSSATTTGWTLKTIIRSI